MGADTYLAGTDTLLMGADTYLAGTDTLLTGADTDLASADTGQEVASAAWSANMWRSGTYV